MSSPTSVDRSQPPENRDRDAENLLGQFLVASFQANKLSELLKEKMIGLPKKDIRLIVPGNPPLSVTVRIEPYREAQGDFLRKVKSTSEKEFVTVVALVESPPLELSKAPGVGHEESTTRLEGAVQDAFVGLFRWWKNYGRQSPDYLKLDEWKTKVSILNSQDAVENTEEFVRSLDALEAKRKGHVIGSP
jgi:hypothetical protein